MKTSRIYLDTSVIGDYFDEEWMADTRELWKQAKAGKCRMQFLRGENRAWPKCATINHEPAYLHRDEHPEFLPRDAGCEAVSDDEGMDARMVGYRTAAG